MPTVAELVQQVADETGLSNASGSSDLRKMLAALNRAYRRVTMETGAIKKWELAPLTAGTLDYRVGAFSFETATSSNQTALFAGRFLSIEEVGYTEDGENLEPDSLLTQVTMSALLDQRKGTAAEQAPTCYAFSPGVIHLDAVPASGAVTNPNLAIFGTLAAPTLVIGDLEAAIYGINPAFHEDVLATLATAIILEGSEGEEQRATYFRGLFAESFELLKAHLNREGGVALPNSWGSSRFVNSDPIRSR